MAAGGAELERVVKACASPALFDLIVATLPIATKAVIGR